MKSCKFFMQNKNLINFQIIAMFFLYIAPNMAFSCDREPAAPLLEARFIKMALDNYPPTDMTKMTVSLEIDVGETHISLKDATFYVFAVNHNITVGIGQSQAKEFTTWLPYKDDLAGLSQALKDWQYFPYNKTDKSAILGVIFNKENRHLILFFNQQ